MKETWRWFGPQDAVSLEHAKQAGAKGIVTALHHLPAGVAWPLDEVLERKRQIEAANLVWSVVESIPIDDSIKLRSGQYTQRLEAWKKSLVSLSKAGIKTVCYNFMPVVDWTRTDLKWLLPTTGYALRFDIVDFAAYDLFILRRRDAEAQYDEPSIASARGRFESMPETRRVELEQTIIAGLPGSDSSHNRDTIRNLLADYQGLAPSDLRSNLFGFLNDIVPVAEETGVRLAIHPDDPPWSLFGLPRVVSTSSDARAILAACDRPANGLTFCVGSYGARADNDLLSMLGEFSSRIHFAHLRQVTREPDGSFYEAEHLSGSADMVAIVYALLEEENRRRARGQLGWEIPMRPDHGHLLGDDVQKKTNPGYSLIGRLKGLAELRGVMHAIQCSSPQSRLAARPG
jgi:mannonate dehydratase